MLKIRKNTNKKLNFLFSQLSNNKNSFSRKEDECAATLVAKALGINEDPTLKEILKFTLNNDLRAASSPFDLAYIAKVMYVSYPNNPEKVMEWVITGLEVKYHEQSQFWVTAKKEFEKTAQVEEIIGPGGRALKMVTVISDDEQISKFARFVYGAAIVIQKQSSGNVQIFTNQKYGLVLYDVAQMLRLAEQEVKGQVITTNWKELASEGKVPGVGEWYFQLKGQMLLNGSLTAKAVPPTRIPILTIKDIVKIGVNPSKFEPGHSLQCQQGICTSRNDKCPWYAFGLKRCRRIRSGQNKKY